MKPNTGFTEIDAEPRRFNDNASRLLIGRGEKAIVEFINSLGFDCHCTWNGKFSMTCPVCMSSDILVCTKGQDYPIWWKCHNTRRCPTIGDRHRKNLIGLVDACMENGPDDAMKFIASYLGFNSPSTIIELTDVEVANRIKTLVPAGTGADEDDDS